MQDKTGNEYPIEQATDSTDGWSQEVLHKILTTMIMLSRSNKTLYMVQLSDPLQGIQYDLVDLKINMQLLR